MAELFDTEALMAVLTDMAKDIKDNYTEHLEFHDRYTREHKLIDSVKTQVEVGDRCYEVTMTLNDYWKYVETGVRGDRNPSSPYKNPGWKAFPHILNWIKIKPVIPRPDRNGRLPSEKQLGYLITRSIVNNGTQGSHDLEAVKDNVIPWYQERLQEALIKDVEKYILKVYNDN